MSSSSSDPAEATVAPGPHPASGPARPDYVTARSLVSRAAQVETRDALPRQRAAPRDRPTVLVLALSVWLSSFLAGLLAVAYSLGRIEEVRELLQDDVRRQRPQIAPDALDRVVHATLDAGLAGMSVIILVQLVFLLLTFTGYRWARVLLTAAGGLGALAAPYAGIAFAERARMLLLAQVLLAVGGAVLIYLPGANSWFRADPR